MSIYLLIIAALRLCMVGWMLYLITRLRDFYTYSVLALTILGLVRIVSLMQWPAPDIVFDQTTSMANVFAVAANLLILAFVVAFGRLHTRYIDRWRRIDDTNAQLAAEIVEREQAQSALRESEAHLAEAQRIGNIGSWSRELATGRLIWSDQVYRMFGLAPGAIEPSVEYLTRHIHPDDFAEYDARRTQAIDRQETFVTDHRIIRPDGEVRYVHQVAEVETDASGRPLRFSGTIQDLTDLRRAEQAVRDGERQLRMIADALPVVLTHYDRDLNCQFVNREARAWLAMGEDDFAGRTLPDIIGAEAYVGLAPYVERALAGESVGFESEITYPDGRTRSVRILMIPERDVAGAVHGLFALTIDLTEHRELEDRLRQSQKMEAVGQLTGGIAHDFNNLMTALLGHLDMAAHGLGDMPDQRRHVEAAARAGERGAELTHRLLAFSRRQPLSPTLTDVNALLGDLQELLQRTLGHEVTISTLFDAGAWPAEVDQGQLENAVLNLAINARDAMTAGGRLTIETRNVTLSAVAAPDPDETAAGDYVAISIRDDGAGIAPEHLQHVIEPFFTTKEVGEGSGLGLSMVYGFVKQSGGDLRIVSEPGHGTTVTLLLPRAKAEATSTDVPPNAEAAAPHGDETVLVIENEPEVRDFAVQALTSLGYRALSAADGAAASAIWQREAKIDALVCDRVLPGGRDGRAVATAFHCCHPAGLVLYTSGADKDRATDADRDSAILAKPYVRTGLAITLRQLLDNTEADGSTAPLRARG